MIRPQQLVRTVLALVCGAALCGCSSSTTGVLEEEKESHYLLGKSRVNTMDYRGAIESFEKALEVNPHSASAHFELGWLLTDKEPDPAAAIYHYQRYLKLRPNAENIALINPRIQVLKQDLAKNVLPPSFTPEMQRDIDQLAEDKRRLNVEVLRLRDEVEKWRAFYASRGGAPAQQTTTPPDVEITVRNPTPAPGASSSGSVAAARTHRVESGENPSSIARKYGVKLDALMAANPGLNPKGMQIGQTINIPAP